MRKLTPGRKKEEISGQENFAQASAIAPVMANQTSGKNAKTQRFWNQGQISIRSGVPGA